MLALRSAPPVFGVAEAERIARDFYGLAVDARPLSGERDCNFHVRTADGGGYVLKIVDGSADPQATACQVNVLGHLREQDPTLPVPRLFPTLQGASSGSVARDGIDYKTCLTGYIPGRLLADVRPERRLLRAIGGMLGRLDRALRGYFHPALGQRIAWDVRRLPELTEFSGYVADPDLRRTLQSVAEDLRSSLPTLLGLPSQAIHGDCHAANLLVDAGSDAVCGVLDFGDMIHAPRVLEPAVAMSELLTDGLAVVEDLESLVEGYARQQALERSEVQALYDLVRGRHAVTLLLHAWRARHDPAGARLVEAAAGRAAQSLQRLQSLGREALTEQWQAATENRSAAEEDRAPVDLGRRQRLLGAGAELFYERPLHFVRGSGVWLYDPEGRPHLDVYNNVPHVGHGHPAVVRAIQDQTARLVTHTRYLHGRILEYARSLTSRCPAHLDACIFVNSGSEANDVAWRIAQFATGQRGAVVMAHAYHGITDAVAALTPGAGEPQDPRVVTLAVPPDGASWNHALTAAQLAATQQDVERAVAALEARGFRPAAFLLDTALTSSGIFDPPPTWSAAVAARLQAAGSLIVADEVQYGLGRSGSHCWGFERRGLTPDIVTLGKPIGNGYPMGVVIARRSLIEAFQARFGFFSTFGGNPVAAAAGLAVLEVIDREFLRNNARDTGAYLREGLQSLAAQHPCLGRVRGSGLLLGLEVLGSDRSGPRMNAREIVNALAARHQVLIGFEGPGADILKLRPPLIFRPEHADRLLQAIHSAAAAIDARD